MSGWTYIGEVSSINGVPTNGKAFILRPRPTEMVCLDCMGGDHEACRREGGYLDDEDNLLRCGCHLTAHALDNRLSGSGREGASGGDRPV